MVGPAARDSQGAALSAAEPIFRRDGERFVPSGHARGPWQPGAQHGGAPAALVAHALHEPGMLVARMTFDFLGPVPLEPIAIRTRVVKPGRRFQLVEAEVLAGDVVVIRARAVRLRRGEVALEPGADAHAPPGGPPGQAVASPFPAPGLAEAFHRTAMEIRFGGGTDYGRGAALAWFRFARPLVDSDVPVALARVAAAADFGNGVSHVLDFERYLFVNTDLTIHLHREPVGEWVLLDARTRVEAHGTGLAYSRLHDEHGPIGVAAQSLFITAR